MDLDPEEARLLVRVLGALHGGSAPEWAAATGLAKSSIWRFETGKLAPRRATLERLAAAAGVPVPYLDAVLLPALRALRAAGKPSGEAASQDPRATSALAPALNGLIGATVAEFLAGLDAADDAAERAEVSRHGSSAFVAGLWSQFAACTGAERRLLVEKARDFQSWRFCQRLCDESERAAADDSTRAIELAQLALRAAALAPGDDALRSRHLGYARAFIANARRVAGELREAESEFAQAWRLWRAGAAAGDVLPEWRLLDLEASLRRALRQWSAALELHGRAIAVAPPEAVRIILLNRAATFDQAGEIEAALATLHEAAPLVEASGDPRLRWALRFNLASSLCHLKRFEEAEALLPTVQSAAESLGNALDLIRALWLAGRVAAGRGRPQEARTAFGQVRAEFTARRMAYDAALVSLEIAVIALASGHVDEVRRLATEMAWIFDAEGVHREALAALNLFCSAAQAQSASLDLARRLVSYLERARNDKDARFEDLP